MFTFAANIIDNDERKHIFTGRGQALERKIKEKLRAGASSSLTRM